MRIQARGLRLGYDRATAVYELDLEIEAGQIVSVVGPNGSGKSTLLKGLARVLRPKGGCVYLDGKELSRYPPRDLARRLAMLPQTPTAPPDITVEELVWRGRHPHLGFFGIAGPADRQAVRWAVRETGLEDLLPRPLAALSGGERQRAWIALALAQQPRVFLLDEPTTYLDVGHQLEVLHLLQRLNRDYGLTMVLVLQDLNQAARFSHRVLVMKEGRLYADGPPEAVITPRVLRDVFRVEAEVLRPADGPPLVVPLRPLSGQEQETEGGPSWSDGAETARRPAQPCRS